MNKRDVMIGGALVALAVVGFLMVKVLPFQAADMCTARIDRVEVLNVPLNTDGVHRIESANGYNMLSISSGTARVVEADCPGGACIKQGGISRAGQVIVCLPHGLIIETHAKNQEEVPYDVIAG